LTPGCLVGSLLKADSRAGQAVTLDMLSNTVMSPGISEARHSPAKRCGERRYIPTGEYLADARGQIWSAPDPVRNNR
jgi:hypothetical protein